MIVISDTGPLNYLILIGDDKDDRNVAIRRGLSVVGTLGVLDEAAQKELLDLADTVLSLRQTNFRVTDALIERILGSLE